MTGIITKRVPLAVLCLAFTLALVHAESDIKDVYLSTGASISSSSHPKIPGLTTRVEKLEGVYGGDRAGDSDDDSLTGISVPPHMETGVLGDRVTKLEMSDLNKSEKQEEIAAARDKVRELEDMEKMREEKRLRAQREAAEALHKRNQRERLRNELIAAKALKEADESDKVRKRAEEARLAAEHAREKAKEQVRKAQEAEKAAKEAEAQAEAQSKAAMEAKKRQMEHLAKIKANELKQKAEMEKSNNDAAKAQAEALSEQSRKDHAEATEAEAQAHKEKLMAQTEREEAESEQAEADSIKKEADDEKRRADSELQKAEADKDIADEAKGRADAALKDSKKEGEIVTQELAKEEKEVAMDKHADAQLRALKAKEREAEADLAEKKRLRDALHDKLREIAELEKKTAAQAERERQEVEATRAARQAAMSAIAKARDRALEDIAAMRATKYRTVCHHAVHHVVVPHPGSYMTPYGPQPMPVYATEQVSVPVCAKVPVPNVRKSQVRRLKAQLKAGKSVL
eukprot:TRINITY_DN23483_c0_g1_i1.p1 TRINITY_DN23483_c0_g1~~TRINITY_DN23483_c0_g1_i1.p1  ORF type:complete len:516 (-),score=175.59 TRINITY_DN23483_c0_g1_i1:246-1793(-)